MLLWDQFVLALEKELGSQSVDAWVRPLKVIRFDALNLYLEAEDPIHLQWFEEHIRPGLSSFLNPNQRLIKVHINSRQKEKKHDFTNPASKQMTRCDSEAQPDESVSDPNEEAMVHPWPTKRIRQAKPQQAGCHLFECRVSKSAAPFVITSDRLDAEYTFDRFVLSEKNQIACKILSSIEKPLFNPICLFGPKGSGKTHLLIAKAQLLQSQKKKFLFVRAETFASHVVQAIRLGTMQQFRNSYREIDALLVDDIHLFARKQATQEEFFHTFNTLHTAGKQIILSTQSPPSKLEEIEPRLLSRFEWGISIGLEKENPFAILSKKASDWQLGYAPEIIQLLVDRFPHNPLLALQALSLRSKGMGAMSPEKILFLLKDLLEKEQEEKLTPEKVIRAVAHYYGMQVEDLLGKAQTRECVTPRKIAMYLCRQKLELPFQAIGKVFQRDHSTVMTSIQQIENLIVEKKESLITALTQISL